jgi:hypothetical protein
MAGLFFLLPHSLATRTESSILKTPLPEKAHYELTIALSYSKVNRTISFWETSDIKYSTHRIANKTKLLLLFLNVVNWFARIVIVYAFSLSQSEYRIKSSVESHTRLEKATQNVKRAEVLKGKRTTSKSLLLCKRLYETCFRNHFPCYIYYNT